MRNLGLGTKKINLTNLNNRPKNQDEQESSIFKMLEIIVANFYIKNGFRNAFSHLQQYKTFNLIRKQVLYYRQGIVKYQMSKTYQ